jgi:short-subunit dehydrogenase
MNIHSATMTTAATPKTILVTGATSGIGRATVILLARRGHRVIATGRNADALGELAAEVDVETLVLHVDDPDSIAASVRRVDEITDGRGVDVLVNNAGFGVIAPLLEITQDDLRRQYETNVFGLLAVTRAFTPAMVRRGQGTVINVGSVGGRMTLPFLASYNSTKYAVESISDGLRAELHPFGVRVALVEPGVIATRFNATAMDRLGGYGKAGSPWADSLPIAVRTVDRSGRFAATPETVARTLVAAAEARRPRARYIAPWHAAPTLWLTKLLPTRVVDAVLRRVSGLHVAAAPALPADTSASLPQAVSGPS